jgi:type I restriction enzyme S subunit
VTLSNGWQRTTLGDLGRYLNGRAFKRAEWRNEGRPIIRIQNLTGSSDTFNYFQGEADDRHVVRHGDLLVSWAATLGAYLWDGPEAVLNQHIFKVESKIDKRFHKYLLDYKLDELKRHTHGSGMVHITRRAFDSVPVHVPDLGEQRRIVELLEDHLSRLDAADASLGRASRLSSAMIQSALSAGLRGTLVEDDVSEGTARDLLDGCPDFVAEDDERVWDVPDTWTWARLGDVFEVNIGATPSRAIKDYWDGDLPWVSSGEVAFGRISSTMEHIAREAAGNPLRRIHPPGTVMLAMIGEGKTRGQAAILDVTAAHNQNCASIRVSATAMLPEYIYGYLEERYIETRRGGAGAQQPALNKGAIQRFPVPIAPLGTQRRLVEAWDSARDAAYRLRGELESAKRRRDSLRRSLLAAAFSGQLTAETAIA